MTPSSALCENCGKLAVSVWTLDDGSEATACERCRPESGLSVRAVGARPTAAITPDAPLTVAEAAERERVSKSTVQRWLASGELHGGAWRTSEGAGTWRIDPAALDHHRAQAAKPPPPTPPEAISEPPEPEPAARPAPASPAPLEPAAVANLPELRRVPPEPKPVANLPELRRVSPEPKPVAKPTYASPAPPQTKPVANPTDWPRRP